MRSTRANFNRKLNNSSRYGGNIRKVVAVIPRRRTLSEHHGANLRIVVLGTKSTPNYTNALKTFKIVGSTLDQKLHAGRRPADLNDIEKYSRPAAQTRRRLSANTACVPPRKTLETDFQVSVAMVAPFNCSNWSPLINSASPAGGYTSKKGKQTNIATIIQVGSILFDI